MDRFSGGEGGEDRGTSLLIGRDRPLSFSYDSKVKIMTYLPLIPATLLFS